jgi:hypothetical protein
MQRSICYVVKYISFSNVESVLQTFLVCLLVNYCIVIKCSALISFIYMWNPGECVTKFRKVGMDKDTEMLVAGTTIINFNLPLCTIVSFIFSSVYLLYPLVVWLYLSMYTNTTVTLLPLMVSVLKLAINWGFSVCMTFLSLFGLLMTGDMLCWSRWAVCFRNGKGSGVVRLAGMFDKVNNGLRRGFASKLEFVLHWWLHSGVLLPQVYHCFLDNTFLYPQDIYFFSITTFLNVVTFCLLLSFASQFTLNL